MTFVGETIFETTSSAKGAKTRKLRGVRQKMAKPKIFLSSTCYDLSIVRSELTDFLERRGFEVINTEKVTFGVTPGRHSHTACLEEVDTASYLLLLIGKRRGGTYVGSENSITNEEYSRAISRGIPCIVCVLREVQDYRRTYKKNPTGDHSHVVDDSRIFLFIDYIASGHSDNWIHTFENIDDLRRIITTQLAHYLFLFSESLRPEKRGKEQSNSSLTTFPSNLDALRDRHIDQEGETALRNGLRALYDVMASILRAAIRADAKAEKLKCMWVFGRYGSNSSESLVMKMDLFKQYAWSYHRGKRVFNQFKPFGIGGDFDEQGDTSLWFEDQDEDRDVCGALKDYVLTLLEGYSENEAYRLFARSDMRCYMKT